MARWWTEAVAAIGDLIPLPLLTLLLLVAAALAAAGWYWFPAWVPRHLPAWRPHRPRWRGRRRRAGERSVDDEAIPLADGDDLPDLPPTAFVSLADRLAEQGRYAESVRERLRAMVRELVDRRVIEHHPGWTVGELAGAAGAARPSVDRPLRAAGGIFSDLWYGQRPARPEHDARMRELADELRRALSSGGGAP